MPWRQSTNACKAEQQKWWAVLNSSYSSVHSFVSFDSSTKMAWKLELSPQQNRLNGSGFGILILLRHYPKANINFGKARVPRVPAPVLMDFWFEVLELSHFLVVQKESESFSRLTMGALHGSCFVEFHPHPSSLARLHIERQGDNSLERARPFGHAVATFFSLGHDNIRPTQ